jgi:hypothetical protein
VENATPSSGLRAKAHRHPVTARLKGSVGDSFGDGLILMLEAMVANLDARHSEADATRRPGMASHYVSATFTDDSGSSTPKQR